MISTKKKEYLTPGFRVVGTAMEPFMLVNSKGEVAGDGPEELDPIDDFEW